MPSIQAPFAGINYGWTLGESNWNTGMDANLVLIDFLMQPTITSYIATPPASPSDGSAYLIAASPTGAWAGNAQSVALRVAGAWVFLTPRNGWLVFSLATGSYWRFTGTVWINTMAVTADAQAAASATLCASPAGVREFMEQYGFTASYMNNVSDLNSVTGSTDRTVAFSFTSSALNLPFAGAYGRGLQLAGGGGYSTQVVWINGTNKAYVRYRDSGVMAAWVDMTPPTPEYCRLTTASSLSFSSGVTTLFNPVTLAYSKNVTVNNGSITVAAGGVYRVGVGVQLNAYAMSAAGVYEPKNVDIRVNGQSRRFCENYGSQHTDGRCSVRVDALLQLNSGDTISVYFVQWTGGMATTPAVSAQNYIDLIRVPS